jgi:hypothetical protein
MPLRKQDDKDKGNAEAVATTGKKFPPEAYAYDSDITEDVVNRVQAEADKVLSKDDWVVVDGVAKQ